MNETTAHQRWPAMPSTTKVEDTTKFLEDLLEKKGVQRQRFMSPLTEADAWKLLMICKTQGINTFSHIKAHMERRLKVDEEYKEAMDRMNQLNKAHFLFRYGDYHAAYVKDLRREVRKAELDKREDNAWTNQDDKPKEPASRGGLTRRNFINQPWVNINAALEAEDHMAHRWEEEDVPWSKPATPMNDLVQMVCHLGQDFRVKRARDTIAEYAARGTNTCISLLALAREGEFHQLANRMERDLKDLSTTPTVCEAYVEATRESIFMLANKYFSTFTWNEDSLELKNAVARTAEEKVGAPREDSSKSSEPKKKKTKKKKGKKNGKRERRAERKAAAAAAWSSEESDESPVDLGMDGLFLIEGDED